MRTSTLLLLVLIVTLLSKEPSFLPWDTVTPNEKDIYLMAKNTSFDDTSSLASIWFIENVGQFDTDVQFQVQAPNGTLFLTQEAIWLTHVTSLDTSPHDETSLANTARSGVNLRLRFVGANPTPQMEAEHPLPIQLSSFKGNDPTRWQTNIPVWGDVYYRNLYPGIDLRLTTTNSQLEYQLVVTDGEIANLADVQLEVEGATRLHLAENHIRAETNIGIISLPLLTLLTDSATSFMAPPPPTLQNNLIISPFSVSLILSDTQTLNSLLLPSNVLASTFVGGVADEWGQDITTDAEGNAYIFGDTMSLDFPTTPGAWDTTPNTNPPFWDGDTFIVKVTADATQLVYATYLGGNGAEFAQAIAVDSSGAAYVTGYHGSSDFPVTPGTMGPFGGGPDIFVVKLGPQGNVLEYVVFLGGTGSDRVRDIAIDQHGAAYVAGNTDSLDFTVTPDAWDTVLESDSTLCGSEVCFDGFVTKINPSGLTLDYSTFLGGTDREFLYGVAVDSMGAAYVTGWSRSEDYPITSGVIQNINGGSADVVATKLHPTGVFLTYSTFIGGTTIDSGADITIDRIGNAYIVGETVSPNFPVTPNALDTTCGTDGMCNGFQDDGFILKLNATASQLLFSTFIGGSGGYDSVINIGIDSDTNVYIVGIIDDPDGIITLTTPGAINRTLRGTVILKMSPDGSTLLHGTTLGGVRGASLRGIAVAKPDVVYVSGLTASPDYPITPNAFDPTCGTDGFCNYVDQPDPETDDYYYDSPMTRLALPAPAITITLSSGTGEITSPYDTTHYQFTADTFTETVVITHAPRHPLSMPSTFPLIAVDHSFANYAIRASTTLTASPSLPYTLTVTYNDSELSTAIESTLALYYWNGQTWVRESSSQINMQTNTVTGNPNRLGWWQLLGETNRRYLPLLHRTP